MRWRPVHLALLVLQALWLNVLVPGHTRGVVRLPGTASAREDSRRPCCACETPADGKHHSPTPGDRANCAVCFFAAHLTLPPVVDCRLAPLGPCELLPIPWSESMPIVDRIDVHFSRGPPTIAA